MKQSKDPFEAAFEEQEDSPPGSPADAFETQNPNSVVAQGTVADQEDDISGGNGKKVATQFTPPASAAGTSSGPNTTAIKNKDDDDEEEEENMDVELGKFPSSGDPDKMAKMQ